MKVAQLDMCRDVTWIRLTREQRTLNYSSSSMYTCMRVSRCVHKITTICSMVSVLCIFYEDILLKLVHRTSRYVNFVIIETFTIMRALYSETLLHWKSLYMQALPNYCKGYSVHCLYNTHWSWK